MIRIHWLPIVSMMWIVGLPIPGIAEEPAKPPTQLEALTQRVGTLEQNWEREKGFLERENSLQQEWSQLEISKQFNTLKCEIQEIVNDLSREKNILIIINSIIAIFVAGVLVWIYNALKYIMTKRMEKIATTLEDVAKNHDIERDRIEHGRITLLSWEQSEADKMERLLKGWGFKNIESKVLTNFEPLKNEQQIVLFNEDICKDQPALIWEYIEKCRNDTVFVAYSTSTLPRDKAQAWNKLIIANMPATLLGHLMTAFRYQDTLKRARS